MPQQLPYGDIFSVSTPYIDRASQQLYKEQQDREAYKRKQNESIDAEFKSLIPGLRTGDTNKFAELYNDYKTSWQQLNNKPPQNQKEYLQAQQDLLRKKAAMYNHVTNSKLKAAQERAIGTSIMGDKTSIYRDDAHQILSQGMQLPYDQQVDAVDPQTGQKIQIDWTNPDALKRHIDTKSVMDAIKFSTGTDQKYSGDKIKEKPTDLDFVQPEITVKNKPTQFYENMRLAATKDPISFLNTLPHPTPDEYFSVEKHYNDVMTPELKKSWRMTDGEDLPPDDNLTDLERAIKYQAMTHALNNLPRVINKRVPAETGERMKKAHEYSQSNIILNASLQGKGGGTTEPPPKTSDGENYDLTERLQGIKVKDIAGKSLGISPDSKIIYNPTTKSISYTSLDGEQKTKSFTDFKKDISTINTAQDLKIVDEVMRSIETPKTENKNKTYIYNGKKFTQQQVEKAAKQNNVSVEEYIKKTGLK